MFDYHYTREIVNGFFNIDNILMVDSNGKQIHLAQVIQEAFPTKKFIVRCLGHACTITFEEELTSQEKTQLDIVVEDYKNYVPPQGENA